MLQITDSEISRAEDILLPLGYVFNEERRNFINCMESCDVVACPGSGKTTALLAKLIILASKVPFSDGRGICVLTHTNVAINEIKRRACIAADVLFSHPNYFGTIQGFVNRFLAIPFYRTKYKRSVYAIDSRIYYAEIEKQYTRNYRQLKWFERRGGSDTLGGFWLKSDDLTIGQYLDSDIPSLGRHTSTYKSIERIRQEILGLGILNYNDAYSLALHYLSKFPSVVEAIRHRFKFVFIDEMQDTDDHQMRVLNSLFVGCDAVILQRLGDPNQAIFDSNVKDNMLWCPTETVLPFSDSFRYGENIAKVLDTIRVDRTLSLGHNRDRSSLPPHLILFDGGNEPALLSAFGHLIREHNLHELEDPVFKAIGWIGKDKREKDRVCLPSYLPEYQQAAKINSHHYGSLLSYVYAMSRSMEDNPNNGGSLFGIAMKGLIRALRLAGLKNPETQRPYTASTLKWHYKKTNEPFLVNLRHLLAGWVIAFRQSKMTAVQMRDGISALVRKYFADNEKPDLTEFLDSDSVDFEVPKEGCANTFISEYGDVIEIGTVHSVKGETHTATLYLETFYHEFDSKRLLPFCLGKYPDSDAKKARHRMNLKIAHVAFSRPTHLLAFACCNKHVEGHEKELEDAGWVVNRI